MKRRSAVALLFLAIGAFVAVLAAEAIWLHHEQQRAGRTREALRRKMRERDGLLAQAPALNAAGEQACADDLLRVRHALAERRAGLQQDEANRSVEVGPSQAIEAFFDIARFVERNRGAAGAATMALRPDERFGFAAYAHEGPALDILPQVYRQRVVIESLLAHLIGAHPRALLSLRREAVGPVQSTARSQGEDYFVMDRTLSVRRPGDIDTMAFRVEFSGQTATLRNFLTRITDRLQPLLVRSVEVEPLPVSHPMAAPGASVLLVGQSLSKFIVVVEAVWPVSTPVASVAAGAPATPAPGGDLTTIWRPVPIQSAGDGWVYELFTPPVIYYNAAERSFAVTPPDVPAREVEESFGLQLVAVHLEPYRLQLTGYFGSPDDYGAVFAISGSPEIVLARVGRRFGPLGLTLKSFEVKKVAIDHGDPWPVYDVTGLATLQDDRSGTEVMLDTRSRKLTNIPLAVLQPRGQGKARELHEGDAWVDGSTTYRLERIQIEPAEVVVARIDPGRPMPEIKTMRLLTATDDRNAPQAGRSQDIPATSPRNIANNGP